MDFSYNYIIYVFKRFDKRFIRIKMVSFNPFSKKEPSQHQMRQEDKKFDHDENILSTTVDPRATDEQIYLEQQQQRSDLIKWQQDLAPEMKILVHKIRREQEVSEGTWKTPEGMKPIANEVFIFDMLGLVDLATSKNLINSNYSEERVLMSLKSTLFDFRCMLQEKREFYKIEKSDMHLIIRLFKNAVEPTYWRCWNNGERKYAGEFNKRVEVHSDSPEVKKKGLFGMGG